MHPRFRTLAAAVSLTLAMGLTVAVRPIAASAKGSARPVSGQAGGTELKVPDIVKQLVAKVRKARSEGRSARPLSHSLLHATRGGEIELSFHSVLPATAAQKEDLVELGAAITFDISRLEAVELPQAGLLQARIPYDRVDDAARLSWVSAITPPGYADQPDTHPINPINSQGVAFHNADDAQAWGYDGTGVTVGVVSDGVTNLAASQAQNELPAVNVINAGSGDEGTAMLEIVHDMAPAAGLAFHGRGGGTGGMVTALNNLVGAGVHVITEDIPFDAEPAFAQGIVAQSSENIAAGGVPVHSSAGNQAGRHAARVTATGTGAGPDGAAGPFAGCANTPDNVVAIAPGNDTTFDVTLGNNARFTLQWSEPRAIFPTAGQGGFTDLNIYVMDAALTTCLGQSTSVQANGQGDTIEQAVVGGMGGTAAKIVVDVQGTSSAVAAPVLDLRWRGATRVDNTTRAGSLNPDANYIGQATTEAALDAQNAGALEGFSSGGPVQLLTTTQCPGGAPGPCAGVAGSSQTATAPTWSAADNVSVSGVGGFGSPFGGTSAATPHAAGCDALLRDALNQPAAATATTNARLAVTAVDIDSAGIDNNTGVGRLDCLAAVDSPPTADAGGPYLTDEGIDVILDGSGSDDPDIPLGDSLTFEWDLDNDGQFDDSTGQSPTFTAVGQDGVFTVRLRVTDEAGMSHVDTTTVTVNNVAPSLSFVADDPKDENTTLTIAGLASDPGWLDGLTATVDWGDGAGAQPLTGVLENARPDATLTFSTPHVYGDDGSFTITVCVSDDDTTTCEADTATIDNVSPTAAIDDSTATIINGVATFLANVGEPVDFAGNLTDPGSDDLLVSWDWDDGSPSPDEFGLYLLNPPFTDPDPSPDIDPRDITDERTHTFGGACLYNITFTSDDDDSGHGEDEAAVIITGNADRSRLKGYWQHQYKRSGNRDFTDEELNCFLAIASYVSDVFNEETDASTIEKAHDVLFLAQNEGSTTEQLDRELLTALLNFANGGIAWDQVQGGLSFADAVTGAESVRLDPSATNAQLKAQIGILHDFNNG